MNMQPSSAATNPERCRSCGGELVVIGLLVDGSNLVMRSCAPCDTRTWQLGRDEVDVETALNEVGHSVGRRRR